MEPVNSGAHVSQPERSPCATMKTWCSQISKLKKKEKQEWWLLLFATVTYQAVKFWRTCSLPMPYTKCWTVPDYWYKEIRIMNTKASPRASQVALVVKDLPANVADIRDVNSIPGLGRAPGGERGNPLQYSCLENPMDRETCRLRSIGPQKVGLD